MSGLRADDIHRSVDWPAVLMQLGIDAALLRPKRQGPCPNCGGKDRFTFDNRKGRGDFYCRGCGPGSGFDLLMRVYGWTFAEARRRVIEAEGLSAFNATQVPTRRIAPPITLNDAPANPSKRTRDVLTSSYALIDCPDAVAYLTRRGLWPMPEATVLRGYVSVDYFEQKQCIGKYAALVAPVTDINDKLVTAHVTYLQDGQKARVGAPRKFLSGHKGHVGCAVRLMPAGEVLGIAEGIETALSAAAIDGVPVWAALNANLLAKFEPPAGVTTLRIYADNDAPGLRAARQLMERLQGRVRLEMRVPKAPHKDFNDQLTAGMAARRIS